MFRASFFFFYLVLSPFKALKAELARGPRPCPPRTPRTRQTASPLVTIAIVPPARFCVILNLQQTRSAQLVAFAVRPSFFLSPHAPFFLYSQFFRRLFRVCPQRFFFVFFFFLFLVFTATRRAVGHNALLLQLSCRPACWWFLVPSQPSPTTSIEVGGKPGTFQVTHRPPAPLLWLLRYR